MRVIKHLPILSLQEAVYGLLEQGQTAQVYRSIPAEAKQSPYITIGLCTVKPEDTKEDALWNCTLAIDIWSTGAGAGNIIEADSADTASGSAAGTQIAEQAKKIYEAVDDISYLMTKYGDRITVDGYKVLDVEVEQSETFPTSDLGYHATVSVRYQLIDK